jgi:class 3 adenylate cyclase
MAFAPPEDRHWAAFLIAGFVFGVSFYGCGRLLSRTRFRSFPLTVLARAFITYVTVVACTVIVIATAIWVRSRSDPHRFRPVAPFSRQMLRILWSVLTSGFLAGALLVGFFIALLVQAIHQFSRKLGPGVLLNWMLGKYHEPHEEERIFMFLDLKNSTPLAEKLGNVRFSRLVRDFFQDLTDPVVQTRGEVSHYIGDEAVLTWKPANGLRNANCLRCFWLLAQTLATRRAYYHKEYGVTPEFKAGLHIGHVVATDVGEIKSEIVYHGDVVNTTARITSLCSELDCALLVSGDLVRRLEVPCDLTATSLGARRLKGKQHEVEVFLVTPRSFASEATKQVTAGVS